MVFCLLLLLLLTGLTENFLEALPRYLWQEVPPPSLGAGHLKLLIPAPGHLGPARTQPSTQIGLWQATERSHCVLKLYSA